MNSGYESGLFILTDSYPVCWIHVKRRWIREVIRGANVKKNLEYHLDFTLIFRCIQETCACFFMLDYSRTSLLSFLIQVSSDRPCDCVYVWHLTCPINLLLYLYRYRVIMQMSNGGHLICWDFLYQLVKKGFF